MKLKSQSGVSLFLAIAIMTVLLGLALAISTILIGQIKMIFRMTDSVVAFYAADTGIEQVLANRHNPTNIPSTALNSAFYEVIVIPRGPNCDAPNFCIKSLGRYKETRRSIEIKY